MPASRVPPSRPTHPSSLPATLVARATHHDAAAVPSWRGLPHHRTGEPDRRRRPQRCRQDRPSATAGRSARARCGRSCWTRPRRPWATCPRSTRSPRRDGPPGADPPDRGPEAEAGAGRGSRRPGERPPPPSVRYDDRPRPVQLRWGRPTSTPGSTSPRRDRGRRGAGRPRGGHLSGGQRPRWPWPVSNCPSSTSPCSTSRPTISTSRACAGSSRGCRSRPAGWSSSLMTGTSSSGR